MCSASTIAAMLTASVPAGVATTRYGIVFDAGSSGSRIHVYSWSTGGGGPKNDFNLIDDDLLKIKPGLSAYKHDPGAAGASLRPLLEHAKKRIPPALVSSAPAFLMATAGLRMVGEAKKDAILASVCTELAASGFTFKCEWATLLSGQDEGLFGWVTVNYLLDRLYPPPASEPVGTIDLGGGSVQIVFTTPGADRAPPGYVQRLDFSGRKHGVYVKSHLGYGLDAARGALLDQLMKHAHDDRPAKHPCLPRGASVTHKEVVFVGDGDWARCVRATLKLFDTTTACEAPPCSFGGAYQPPLPPVFYGFSYMYDRTAAIGLLDGKPAVFGTQQMTTEAIAAAGEKVCALDKPTTAERFAAAADAPKADNFCGDVAYIVALLRSLGFSSTAPLTMTNKIKGVELVWTLGAMLAKSAELAAGHGSSGSSAGGGGSGGGGLPMRTILLVASGAALLLWLCGSGRLNVGYHPVQHEGSGKARPLYTVAPAAARSRDDPTSHLTATQTHLFCARARALGPTSNSHPRQAPLR